MAILLEHQTPRKAAWSDGAHPLQLALPPKIYDEWYVGQARQIDADVRGGKQSLSSSFSCVGLLQVGIANGSSKLQQQHFLEHIRHSQQLWRPSNQRRLALLLHYPLRLTISLFKTITFRTNSLEIGASLEQQCTETLYSRVASTRPN